MPYFFICPVYVGMVCLSIMAGCAILFITPLRWMSGYVFSGTAGTLPGVIIGNIIFGILYIGLILALKIPFESIGDSQVLGAAIGVFAIAVLIGGLALANILGYGLGFIAGCWIYRKFKKENRTRPSSQRAARVG